jgi:hypothetical protein
LPWSQLDDDSVRAGADIKTMSVDEQSGASTNVVRYPRGWSISSPHHLTCDEELFVLDGALCIGGTAYSMGDYAYLPAGFVRASMHSPDGATVLTFFEGRAAIESAARPVHAFARGDLIERVASQAADWEGASDPQVASSRVRRLVLRPDTPAGERTWLLAVEASETEPFAINGIEQHPCVEEMFLLTGDLAMSSGVLQSGAYFWRPPMIKHGPMGTKNGFLGLFRAKEGHFSTIWSETNGPIPWNAAYAPVVPASLQIILG